MERRPLGVNVSEELEAWTRGARSARSSALGLDSAFLWGEGAVRMEGMRKSALKMLRIRIVSYSAILTAPVVRLWCAHSE